MWGYKKKKKDWLMFSEFTFGDLFRILKNSQRIIYTISLDTTFLKKKHVCFLFAIVLNSVEFAQLLSTMAVPAFFHVTIGLLSRTTSILLYFVSTVYSIFLIYSILVLCYKLL